MLNFAIFKAKQKKTEKSPDYTSTVKVDSAITLEPGVEYQLAGWINTPRRGGKKYISVVIKPKQQQEKSASWEDMRTPADDDDIPF